MSDAFNDAVLTVQGAYETHKGTDEQYQTISVQELMTIERTAVPKDQARWVLCSTYNEPDGRSHKAQEERGRFVMVAIDLDTGNVQGKALVAAVQKFTGQVQMRVYSSSSATKAARKWTSAFQRLRSLTTCHRPAWKVPAPLSASWRVAPNTAAIAWCPTPAAKKSADPWTMCWSRWPDWRGKGSKRSRCWAKT